MLNESSIIHDNVKKFRGILNEASNQGNIGEAIDNKKILYIYYAGDNTHRRGYRTVEPHAIGYLLKTDKKGNKTASNELAVRAWEQAGASDTFKDPVGRWARNPPRMGHEKWQNDQKGRAINPGWRLFKLDGIANILFTGEEFTTRSSFKPGDKQLSVVKEVKPDSPGGSQSTDGVGSIDVADVLKQKMDAFNTQSDSWKMDASKGEEELIKNIIALGEKVSTLDKGARKNYEVFKEQGKYYAINRQSTEYPEWKKGSESVGNLMDLYNKYSDADWKDKNFLDKIQQVAMNAEKKAQKNEV